MRISAFFDFVDYDSDVDFFKSVLKDFPKSIDFIPSQSEEEFELSLVQNSVALIDYGAVSVGMGFGSLVDHYDNWILKIIQEHPSIIFIFLLSLGPEPYMDNIWECSNVKVVQKGSLLRKNLFSLIEESYVS